MFYRDDFLIAVVLVCLSGCAKTPLPIATIPQKGREISSELSFGNNGINLNTVYTSKTNTVFNLALQTSFFTSRSNVYDLGLGQITRNKRMLFMATFGYGRHSIYHFPMSIYGSRQYTYTDAFRASLYWNVAIGKNVFLILRPSYYWGDTAHTTIGYRPSSRYLFSRRAVEPALTGRIGKRKRVILGISGFWSYEESRYSAPEYSPDYIPNCFWLFIGYRLGKSF